nr:hypothetical protein [Tanacetum cinerariifolium]
MFLNMDQLEKQLDKEEFQETGSMAAFKVLETQFQKFIKSRFYLEDEYTTKEKVDTSKALDASLVETESNGTESKKKDTSSKSGNDIDADDADIKPIYNEEPMVEKRVFNANHNACVTKFLNEVNSRRIFNTVGLRRVPTGKIFASSTTKADIKAPNGSNEDITNPYECEQTLNVGADTTTPSKQELDHLFGPLYDEFFTAGTSCVNQSSSPIENSTQQDTPPSVTAQSTTDLITPTTTITTVKPT